MQIVQHSRTTNRWAESSEVAGRLLAVPALTRAIAKLHPESLGTRRTYLRWSTGQSSHIRTVLQLPGAERLVCPRELLEERSNGERRGTSAGMAT